MVERARGLFLSGGTVDPRALSRTFTVLAQDLLAATSGPALFAGIAREAPGVRLRFLMESPVDGPFPLGLRTFEIPFPLSPLPFGMAWHPRHDADPAHTWLRGAASGTWHARRPRGPVTKTRCSPPRPRTNLLSPDGHEEGKLPGSPSAR